MKYVFVGNRKFVLEEMIKNKLDLVKIFVISNTHLENDIKSMHQPYSTISSKKELLSELENLEYDILISNGCPYILPIKEMKKKQYINIHPIQRGGLLTPEAFKALVHFGDGYSICDHCLKGRIDEIENPPVMDFLKDMALFLDIDNVMPTAAAREAKRIVMENLAKIYPKRKTVIIDSLAHYTTYLAIENNNLRLREVPNSGYPKYNV